MCILHKQECQELKVESSNFKYPEMEKSAEVLYNLTD